MTNQNGLEWDNKPSHATVPLNGDLIHFSTKQLETLNTWEKMGVELQKFNIYS